ncbi:histidine kinase [Ornithinibacillus sp. 4-3]|uniref:Histidine kinase n=1 Tax=Ornithinibacillus sp. 4-3 TaxID=3231488 RepID=A0AB39HQE6_9BACI
MVKFNDHVDESILVCVYYGPNGERLIKRGHILAQLINCPMYVLTVDPLPLDEFDAEKAEYIDRWKELCEELEVDEFILMDNESRPAVKVIKEVAYSHHVTQIVIGQTPINRWEEITKGSFVSALQREISSFIDLHIVSVDRSIKSNSDTQYEKGVRGFLQYTEEGYELSFTRSKRNEYEGIFYKEIGTDFNNGVFKFVCKGITSQVHIDDNKVREEITQPPNMDKE